MLSMPLPLYRDEINQNRLFASPHLSFVRFLQGLVMCDGVDFTMRRYFGLLYGHMGR